MSTGEQKLIDAMTSVRRAMGLVETFAEAAPRIPESLIGVHPKLRAILDDLNCAVHELREETTESEAAP